MSIRQMIPMGTQRRCCFVCGYRIYAKDNELTAHEIECLESFVERARAAPAEEQDK